MDRRPMGATFDVGPELQEVYERLRQVGGPALAQGQTPCCFALSGGHPLLRALHRILTVIPVDLSRRSPQPSDQTRRRSYYEAAACPRVGRGDREGDCVLLGAVRGQAKRCEKRLCQGMLDDPCVNFAISMRGNA